MFELEIEGFDEIQRNLGDLEKKMKKLESSKKVPLVELLNEDFLRRTTKFKNLEEMFKASGFSVSSEEDFKKIPDNEWDVFIANHTHFSNWKEMGESAGKEWVAKELGLQEE